MKRQSLTADSAVGRQLVEAIEVPEVAEMVELVVQAILVAQSARKATPVGQLNSAWILIAQE
jgi:hypothetical protein